MFLFQKENWRSSHFSLNVDFFAQVLFSRSLHQNYVTDKTNFWTRISKQNYIPDSISLLNQKRQEL